MKMEKLGLVHCLESVKQLFGTPNLFNQRTRKRLKIRLSKIVIYLRKM
jgi:hypothetical protein